MKLKMKKKKVEQCCGNCCWFVHETTNGDGCCVQRYFDADSYRNCGDNPCGDFVPNEEKRHHMAVLLQCRRVQDDPHPGMINVKVPSKHDIANAMDFAVRYVKTFERL